MVVLFMVHDLAGKDMFHDLTADTDKRYWHVVFCLVFLSFCKGSDDVC